MKSDKLVHGEYVIQHWRNNELVEEQVFPNGVVNAGLHYLLEAGFRDGAKSTTWYVGLIDEDGFTALNNADTMASHAGWTELTAYDADDRPAWVPGAASGRQLINTPGIAFAINSDSDIVGAFLADDDTKGGSSGLLFSTALLNTPIEASNGSIITLTYRIYG